MHCKNYDSLKTFYLYFGVKLYFPFLYSIITVLFSNNKFMYIMRFYDSKIELVKGSF